MARSLSG